MWSTDIDVEKLKIEYEKLKDENMKLHKQVEELKKEFQIIVLKVLNVIFFRFKLETLKPAEDN